MKKYVVLFLVVALGLPACKKDVNSNKYDTSYQAWVNFKQKSNNSYSYTVLNGSVFSVIAWETKISVQNGTIIARDFLAYKTERDSLNNNVAVKKMVDQWHEDTASLGVHDHAGATPFTLDEVYKKARTEWLPVDKSKNDVYLETNNNGMISSCGFVPKGCQDDCFNGIKISAITAL